MNGLIKFSKISSRLLNTASRSPDFFVSEQVTLRTTVRQFPLTGLKVALCNGTPEAKQFANTLGNYGAEIHDCGWSSDSKEPTNENQLRSMLHRMDIVIDSKLCKDLNFRSDNDVLKWNTKMIFVKLVDGKRGRKSKEEEKLQHLSDVNKILLALYEREHSGIGQVVEVHQN